MSEAKTPNWNQKARSVRRCHLTLLLALSGALVVPLGAMGQELTGLKVVAAQKRFNGSIKRILRGDEPLQGNEKSFDDFFLGYGLATIIPDDPQVDVGKARINFQNQYLDGRTSQNKQARDHLNQLTMDTMTKAVANPNFNYPARINATLVIGMLEETPSGGAQATPVPLPAACEFLLQLLEGKVAGTENFLDALSMPALAGLERHAKYGMSPDHRQRLTQIALNWIKEEPPQSRDPEVHVFFRNRGAEVLGVLRATGDGNDVVTALREVINNEEIPLEPRCQIARPLGQLKFDASAADLSNELVGELGALTLVVLDQKVKEGLKSLSQDGLGGARLRRPRGGARRGDFGGMGDEGFGGFGGEGGSRDRGGAAGRRGGAPTRGQAGRQPRGNRGGPERPPEPDPDPVETFIPREQWATLLASLQAGLGSERDGSGPLLVATDEAKKIGQKIDKSIDKAIEQLQDKYLEDQKLIVALADVRVELAETLEPLKKPAAPTEVKKEEPEDMF